MFVIPAACPELVSVRQESLRKDSFKKHPYVIINNTFFLRLFLSFLRNQESTLKNIILAFHYILNTKLVAITIIPA